MSPISKLAIGAAVILLALLALAGQFLHVPQTAISHTLYTTNAGQLTTGVLVGQTFVSESDALSGVGVQFATYSNRANTKPVEFSLYEFPALGTPIETARVSAADLRDNQIYRFSFSPIPNSKGKTYFFSVTSVQSVDGDAVTVDVDTRDPYHRGAAYIVRADIALLPTVDLLNTWGKPTVDVSFETYHSVRLREALVAKVVGSIRFLIASWPSQRSQYLLYLRIAGQSLLVLLLAWLVGPERYKKLSQRLGSEKLSFLLLTLLLVAAAAFRIVYAINLPVTNDEGNYFYDARTWREGHLAGGDGYVKAPLVVAWIALWQMLFGDTVLAGRLSSIMAGVLTMYPLYFLARELKDKRTGLLTAGLWALTGSGIVFSIYVHTQPLSLLFGTAGLATLLMALNGTTLRLTFVTVRKAPSFAGWFILSGVLLGLGVASRKSILALGLLPLLFILLQGKTWKLRGKHFFHVALGFLVIMLAFIFFAWWVYGPVGIQEAIGLNSAEDGITVSGDDPEQVRAYSLRGMTPFFRESLPLILLLAVGWGAAWETAIRSLMKLIKQKPPAVALFLLDHVVPKLGWIGAWWIFWWAWSFFTEYEGQAFMVWGIPWLWYGFTLILLILTCLPRRAWEKLVWASEPDTVVAKTQQPGVADGLQAATIMAHKVLPGATAKTMILAAVTAILWMGGLAFFYINWIKFHANYISEFIPPVILLAGLGFASLFERFQARLFLEKDYPMLELLRRIGVLAVALLLFWSLYVTNYITFVFEHTGTFDQQTAKQAALWAREHIPLTDPVFTGAALIPYLSGHHISLDIAHPRWYAYEFTRLNTKRLNTFLPPAQQMVDAYAQAKWVLMDEQTKFSFFMEYPFIENSFPKDFIPVKEFGNLSNTLTFYQRVSQ